MGRILAREHPVEADLVMGVPDSATAAGIGYAIGEVTGLAVNRKRGTWLAVIGGLAVAASYAVGIFTLGQIPGVGLGLVIDIIGVVVGITTAVSRLR